MELMKGKSTVLALTTGYGKSLPYQMFASIMKKKENGGLVVVVAPLNAILI